MKPKYKPQVESLTWSSIFINLLLFALKLWAGLVSMSVTLLADAWHTLSDSFSSVIVLVAIKVSKKPADDDHPYGHGRAEVIAAVLVGAMLGFVSFHFLIESASKLLAHKSATYGPIALWVTVVGIIIKEAMARISIVLGKKAESRALIADGWHHRSDALSSIIVLVGIFLNPYLWFVDGLMGILISFFIAYVAYGVLNDSISALLGENHDEQILLDLQKLSNEVAKMDVQAHHLQIHEYGDHLEMVFHIRLPGHWTLTEVHTIVDELEQAIEAKYGGYVNIHVDPIGIA